MIPETTKLTAQAQQQIEEIDTRLDELEAETKQLLEQRSKIVDQHSE